MVNSERITQNTQSLILLLEELKRKTNAPVDEANALYTINGELFLTADGHEFILREV